MFFPEAGTKRVQAGNTGYVPGTQCTRKQSGTGYKPYIGRTVPALSVQATPVFIHSIVERSNCDGRKESK